jgi:hypothetical protein
MTYVRPAAELLLAALAVFGLYALLRLLVTARFSAARVYHVLYVRALASKQQVLSLLSAVREERFFYPGAEPLLLLQEGASDEVIKALQREGVAFYIIKNTEF